MTFLQEPDFMPSRTTIFTSFAVACVISTLGTPDTVSGEAAAVLSPRAARLKVIASTIAHSDQEWTTSFSPSIRLKSFDRALSNFVAKRAGPEFDPGPSTSAACGMQRFQMKLTDSSGSTANEFAVLLDPQPAGSAVKPSFLIARTEVLHVDADGSPRSYHPDDPLGGKSCKLSPGPSGGFVADRACAMDQFGNARIRLFEGPRELHKKELEAAWARVWPRIRDGIVPPLEDADIPPELSKYYGFDDTDQNLSAFFKRAIIPPTDHKLPCIRDTASRFKGYFVAATALSHGRDVAGADIDDANRIAPKECTPLRWIDASTVPFFVLPGGPFGDVAIGDVAAIYAVINGEERLVYGVIGDSGPTQSFGEASVSLIQLLKKGALLPVENNRALNSWDIDGTLTVTILLLGKTKAVIGKEFTRDAIEKAGRQVLGTWNKSQADILARLRACSSQAPVNKHS